MRKILVVLGMPLLAVALEDLFSEEANFRLASIPFSDGKAALECIHHFSPDMLIIDESVIKAGQLQVLGLLELYPQLSIMIVNPDSNQVRIYEQRVINISRSSDLLASIQSS